MTRFSETKEFERKTVFWTVSLKKKTFKSYTNNIF